MAIAKTKLVNISADLEKMDRVLGRFVELDCIHPVASSQIVDRVHGLTAFTGENPCTQVLTEISEIELTFDFPIKDTTIDEVQETLESMRSFVSGVHSKLVTMTVQKKNELELVHKYQDALIQIQNIESLDISLDDVFSCDYISSRVGRLPTDSVEKLRFYRNRPFIFKSFSMDRNYSWCMYFTTSEFEREVDNIFSSLFFERIHIPDFVHGTPEAAEVNLENEIEFATSQMERTKVQIYTYLNEVEDRLIQTKAGLKLLEKVYEAKQYVVGMGGKFTITGFIEPTDEAILREKFHDIPGVEISIRPASSDMRLKPPTKLKEGWFSRPFTFFVEMYGLPSYGDIDPTPFVAISYSLLFGILFGDFGQGLLLSLIGWLFARKGMKLGQVGLRIGLSSAFFGLLFGSLFGNEEILASLYTKIGITFLPIHVMNADFTMTLLLLAISLGALLIITSLSINIYLQYKKKKYVEMVLSHNGFAGLLFYLYFLGGLLLKLVFTINIFT
ncbi:MAG: V-type ATP synthase subunit I, partial [Candidatus Izemoplasmatales bacterium]